MKTYEMRVSFIKQKFAYLHKQMKLFHCIPYMRLFHLPDASFCFKNYTLHFVLR